MKMLQHFFLILKKLRLVGGDYFKYKLPHLGEDLNICKNLVCDFDELGICSVNGILFGLAVQ